MYLCAMMEMRIGGAHACRSLRSILLPQNEQFYVADSMWVNLDNVPKLHGWAGWGGRVWWYPKDFLLSCVW